jgi:hypothetical protein
VDGSIFLRAAAVQVALVAAISLALVVLVGVHWLGVLPAVLLFAAWCARLPREETVWT